MAAFYPFQALVFVIIASSLVAVSKANGWCSQNQNACNSGYVCCNDICVTGSDCYDQYCTVDSDCSSGQSCCNSQCKYGSDCSGYSCSVDSDCGLQYCCYGSCSYDSDCYNYNDIYYDPTAAIVGSLFGAMLFICMISLCIFFACRRRRTIVRPGRVIVGQRITTTTATASQANPPYPGQMPQSYQQGYPYYPPPKYEQHQTAIPRQYNPGTTAASEQPPPYSAATQGRSGGVYAPQTSYGAVKPAPSAPSVL